MAQKNVVAPRLPAAPIEYDARFIDQLTNIFYKCVEPHVSQILWNDLVRELRMDGVTGLLQSVTESTASEN